MTSPNDPRVMAAINVAMKAMYSKLGTVGGLVLGSNRPAAVRRAGLVRSVPSLGIPTGRCRPHAGLLVAVCSLYP